jgi:hypothetical protein
LIIIKMRVLFTILYLSFSFLSAKAQNKIADVEPCNSSAFSKSHFLGRDVSVNSWNSSVVDKKGNTFILKSVFNNLGHVFMMKDPPLHILITKNEQKEKKERTIYLENKKIFSALMDFDPIKEEILVYGFYSDSTNTKRSYQKTSRGIYIIHIDPADFKIKELKLNSLADFLPPDSELLKQSLDLSNFQLDGLLTGFTQFTEKGVFIMAEYNYGGSTSTYINNTYSFTTSSSYYGNVFVIMINTDGSVKYIKEIKKVQGGGHQGWVDYPSTGLSAYGFMENDCGYVLYYDNPENYLTDKSPSDLKMFVPTKQKACLVIVKIDENGNMEKEILLKQGKDDALCNIQSGSHWHGTKSVVFEKTNNSYLRVTLH